MTTDYSCRKCHCSMYVPDGMDPLEPDVRFCESCAIDEIERLQARVAELESENTALATTVHDLSPSDPLTWVEIDQAIEAVGEGSE